MPAPPQGMPAGAATDAAVAAGIYRVQTPYSVMHSASYTRPVKLYKVKRIYGSVTIELSEPVTMVIQPGSFMVYETANPLVKLDDVRHSPVLDEEDTTTYKTASGTSGSPVELLRIDYGVQTTATVCMVLGYWVDGELTSAKRLAVETSADGSSWSRVWSAFPSSYTAEHIHTLYLEGLTMRYLRFIAWTENTEGYVYLRVRKVLVWRA